MWNERQRWFSSYLVWSNIPYSMKNWVMYFSIHSNLCLLHRRGKAVIWEHVRWIDDRDWLIAEDVVKVGSGWKLQDGDRQVATTKPGWKHGGCSFQPVMQKFLIQTLFVFHLGHCIIDKTQLFLLQQIKIKFYNR